MKASYLLPALLLFMIGVACGAEAKTDEDIKREIWKISFVDSLIKDPHHAVEIYKNLNDPTHAGWRQLATGALDQFPGEYAGNASAKWVWELLKDTAPIPSWKKDSAIQNMIMTDTGVAERMANQAYDIEIKAKTDPSNMTEEDDAVLLVVRKEVQDGRIISPTEDLSKILLRAPGGVVTSLLREDLDAALAAGKDRDKVLAERMSESIRDHVLI